jgi:threonylcarbamoyladenosine tRNA methylthiotransferase MtaB
MRVYLDTIGCRLNQGEIEAYGRQFRALGHTLVSDPAEADLVIINTCTVTAAAASDSRQKIRQAARAGAGEIIATGCWSTLSPDQARALPGVSRVIANQEKDSLVADLLQIPTSSFDLEPIQREPIPGARARTRSFIKVQDGCDNHCTFCITTLARGAGRSRPISQVLEEIRTVLQGEAASREIVLTGVHLGSWGSDFARPLHLSDLVRAILADTDISRLRLSSLEPWDLTESFFDLWQNPRLCRHLHLPLQSGCARTLKRMARKTTPEDFAALVRAARAAIPGVAITTDVITGFPGEDEAEFSESLEFVRAMEFAGGHTFTYSTRPGTAAARLGGQVPHPVRKERSARMRLVLADAALAYRQSFIGTELDVLWENVSAMGPDAWRMSGLTDNYLRVHTRAAKDYWNRITRVRLDGLQEDGAAGIIISE